MEEKQEEMAPGVRFYPTEEELIGFYLHNKLHGVGPDLDPVIPSLNLYNFDPPQLPGLAGQVCRGEKEQWFFFMPQQEREARGGKPHRTTPSGYWKATGSPTYVYSQNKVIALKKNMVFYKGKAPTGRKTKWKMNEYKAASVVNNNSNINHHQHTNNLIPSSSSTTTTSPPQLRQELSLCRVYVTSGCARAFDRRPPSGTLVPNNNVINTHQNVINNNNQQDNQQGISRAVPQSSSTDDHNSSSTTNTSGNDCYKNHQQQKILFQHHHQNYPTGITAETSNTSYYEIHQMTQDLEPLFHSDDQFNNWL